MSALISRFICQLAPHWRVKTRRTSNNAHTFIITVNVRCKGRAAAVGRPAQRRARREGGARIFFPLTSSLHSASPRGQALEAQIAFVLRQSASCSTGHLMQLHTAARPLFVGWRFPVAREKRTADQHGTARWKCQCHFTGR